jgi:hypothetical protein
MSPIIRNVLAVFLGWLGGSAVNMGLIQIGSSIYPIEGIDPTDMEALAKVMPTLTPEYFIYPFLGHALGTLVGAIIAGLIAATNKMKFSLTIGVLFLVGGLIVNYLLPGPIWFTVLDLVVAYLPMGWLGGIFAIKMSGKK